MPRRYGRILPAERTGSRFRRALRSQVMERTGPQVNVAPTRCPYCHEGIPRGEQPAVCPGCHALHHTACLDEAGACAACGRRASSPEDSKLAAALRARASARVANVSEERPARRADPEVVLDAGAVLGSFALGAVLGVVGFLSLGYPALHALALAVPCGLLGVVTGNTARILLALLRR